MIPRRAEEPPSADPAAIALRYRRVRLYLVVALLLLIGTAVYLIEGQREQIWGSARSNLLNLALGVRTYSTLVLEQPALSVRGLATDLAAETAASRVRKITALRAALRLDSVSRYWGVTDSETGETVLVDRTGQPLPPDVELAVRGLIGKPRGRDLELWQLVELPHEQGWYLPVTLAVQSSPNPEVAFALVPANRLIEGTESLSLVRDGWIGLVTSEGARLLSYSRSRGVMEVNGPPVPTEIMRMAASDSGSLQVRGPIDGMLYLLGYARSRPVPLWIAAMVPVSALYATWSEQSLAPALVLAIGIAAVIVFWVQLHAALRRQMAYVTEQAYLVRERERAETALRDSHELLQTIIDNSPAIVYVKDLEGRYLLVNRCFEESMQIRREATLGRTDHELFPTEAADGYRAMDQRVVASDAVLTEEQILPEARGPRTYINVKAPLRDAAGKVRGIFGISTDITERKQAELGLRAQFERLSLLDRTTRAIGERHDLLSIFQVAVRSLEEQLPIDFGCACLYDPKARVLEVASVGVKSHALARELALPEHARIDIEQNGLGRCALGQLEYLPDTASASLPFQGRLAHGGLRALVVAPLAVQGAVFGALVVARARPASFSSEDCEFLRQLSEHLALAVHQTQLHSALQQAYDDLRQSQEAVVRQERLRALGQMAAGIAHDINNALAPAYLYLQSLAERNDGLDEESRSELGIIQRAIEDVARTVSRMKEFSRPRDLELTLASLDLNALLRQAADLTRVRWSDMPQEHGVVIQLDLQLEPDLPPVLGAQNEIRDALTNLILNAVDAMPEGGTLTLRSRSVQRPAGEAPAPGRFACVEVCDTGVGMTEEVRARCLEPFFTTKGERGTGLGLAMVYGMVQRHGAELQIDSRRGQGTTVRLTFPAAVLEPRARIAPRAGEVGPLHILVVDDDPLLLKSLKDVLESDGHRVTVADGGQAGIDLFFSARGRRDAFGAVITDLGMPRIDGRAVAAAIKSRSPHTPVILLTGWDQRLKAENTLPEHVDRVLGKPPRLGELRAALAELTAAAPAASAQ